MLTQDTTLAPTPARPSRQDPATGLLPRFRLAALTWRWPALVAILLGAGLLNLWGLAAEGYANTYYAAAIKSMLTSWHNFFYASFDSGGFVAVDKPPLGLWVQAGFAKLFGFSGLSILLPEALAGVLAVALLYYLVARAWGAPAGLLAALFLALTPISVVVSRNNTIDSLLILTLLCGAWAATRAAQTGRLRWLLLCALIVGLGFNIKMLQAYLVVPAFGLTYLLTAPIRRRSRLGGLGLALLVLLAVSLSWSLAVDLTPASARPYVSDSGTNSELSLALGYNGLGRVTTTLLGGLHALRLGNITIDLDVAPAFAPEIGNPSPWRLFGGAIGEQASWLLVLAFLGLVAGVVHVFRRRRPRLPLDRQGQAIVLWGGWLVVACLFFSASRFFHLYYLVMLAPPVAALAGIGVVALWRAYRGPGWAGWALPAALVSIGAAQAYILGAYPTWGAWLTPLVVGLTVVAALGLVAARLRVGVQVTPETLLRAGPRTALAVAGLGVAGMLVAPATWSGVSVANGAGAAWLPQAGPATSAGFGRAAFAGRTGAGGGGFGGPGSFAPPGGGQPSPGGGASGRGGFGFGGGGAAGRGGFGRGGGAMTFSGTQASTLDPKLVRYLLTHQGTARYLVATTTSSYASLFILATDQPAMALGGYQGWDHILTPAQLAQLVAAGIVRYFYIPATAGGAGSFAPGIPGGVGAPQAGNTGVAAASSDATGSLTQWVRAHCTAVPSAQWQTQASTASRSTATPTSTGAGQQGGPSSTGSFAARGQQLYACAR